VKVVVTGATGFIGSATAKALKLQHHEVIEITRTSSLKQIQQALNDCE